MIKVCKQMRCLFVWIKREERCFNAVFLMKSIRKKEEGSFGGFDSETKSEKFSTEMRKAGAEQMCSDKLLCL